MSSSRILPTAEARRVGLFVLQQALVFGSSVAFLLGVRACTGRTVHGAADPVGPLEAAGILAMLAAHVALTVGLHRRFVSPRAPLGLAPSWCRVRDAMGGALGAFVFFAAPWLVTLAVGRAHIDDHLGAHWRDVGLAQIAFWLLALWVNSFAEETSSRAFPMRLWAYRPLWQRALLPSLAFALLHLADEPFRLDALAYRTVAGVSFSLAYALRGHVWLAAGLHTGLNFAIIARSGAWHSGALVAVSGEPVVPDDVVNVVFACALGVAYYLRVREKRLGVTPVTRRNCA